MTLGKLLDNDTQLFIFYFYSNSDSTSPKGPRKQNRFSERRFSEKTSYNRLNWKLGIIGE